MCQNGAHETYMFLPVQFQQELPSPVGRSGSEIPCARPEPKQPVAYKTVNADGFANI